MIGLACDVEAATADPAPPEAAPLRASMDAFTASLLEAHPCIFMRPPALPIEDIAALLHMSLDHCRELLAVYDSIASADAVWLFDPLGGEQEDEDEAQTGDDEDLPF